MGSFNVRSFDRAAVFIMNLWWRKEGLQYRISTRVNWWIWSFLVGYVFDYIRWIYSFWICLLPITIHGTTTSVWLSWSSYWHMAAMWTWWFLRENRYWMAIQLWCSDIDSQLGSTAWLSMLATEARWSYRLCLLRWCSYFSSDYSKNRWHYWAEKTNANLLNLPASGNIGIFHNDRVLASSYLFLRTWTWLWW